MMPAGPEKQLLIDYDDPTDAVRRRTGCRPFVAAAVLAGLAATGPAGAAERIAGPVEATVERVLDGDTLAVRAHIWLGQEVAVLVRIRGIDTPELRGRCAAERARAVEARAALAEAVAGGPVVLSRIEPDKYGGRVLADVSAAGVSAVGHHMIAQGFARAYAGRSRGGWC